MNSACHGLKMSFSEERCRNCKKIPSLSFNLVPQTISNTVSSMQIVLASVFTKYLQSISAEPRLESGLPGRHAGVTWMVCPWHPMASLLGRLLQESRFPFTELPFDGIFGLGLAGLSAGFSATFGRLLEHFWSICHCHLSFLSGWVMLKPIWCTYLMYRKVFSGVPHIFSCKALGLKTRIDVIFLKGRTFFQLCQPFGRLVPNYDELLWWC